MLVVQCCGWRTSNPQHPTTQNPDHEVKLVSDELYKYIVSETMEGSNHSRDMVDEQVLDDRGKPMLMI